MLDREADTKQHRYRISPTIARWSTGKFPIPHPQYALHEIYQYKRISSHLQERIHPSNRAIVRIPFHL